MKAFAVSCGSPEKSVGCHIDSFAGSSSSSAVRSTTGSSTSTSSTSVLSSSSRRVWDVVVGFRFSCKKGGFFVPLPTKNLNGRCMKENVRKLETEMRGDHCTSGDFGQNSLISASPLPFDTPDNFPDCEVSYSAVLLSNPRMRFRSGGSVTRVVRMARSLAWGFQALG